MSVRIGLAGLGVHGQRYAAHLLRGDVPGARLTVVSRRDEKAGRAFAAEHGLTYVGDPLELATHGDVDAVAVVLRPDLHAGLAEACLSARRPVLVEKPLAPDVTAARRLVESVERTGTPLMVGHTLRYDAVIRALERESADLGGVRLISLNQRFEPSARPWIDTPGCGGLFLNTGVHGFDLLRHLTGLEAVSVSATSCRALTQRTEDQFVATVTLGAGNVLATVDNTRSSMSRSGRIELIGATGQVWGDHIHRTLERVRGRERVDLGPVPALNTLPELLKDFVGGLAHNRPPAIDVHDGLASIEMVEAATLSARLGRPVTVAELRE